MSDTPSGSKSQTTQDASAPAKTETVSLRVVKPETESTPRHTKEEATPVPAESSLSDPELYLNRELTWLAFNQRVLHEAQDPRTPLLERVKFLAIVSDNLDEFFMKRIGGLKQQIGAGLQTPTVDGRTPERQLQECYAVIRKIEHDKDLLLPVLLDELATHGVDVPAYTSLTSSEQAALRSYYVENIYPLVTPQAVDMAHPFPFISNLSLNLLVTLCYPDDLELRLARVKIPSGTGIRRFVPVGQGNRFVHLADLIANNLDLLFPRMTIKACERFHVTRNANTDRDQEEADDLMATIESEVRDRKFAPIVRVVVEEQMDPGRRGMLAAELGLAEDQDVFETAGLMAMGDLWELAGLNIPELHDPPHYPLDHARLQDERSIFHIIRESGSLLLQHPYESFTTSVERFLREASEDPKVLAIKMTLYRTSAETKVMDYLIQAARNGKQVAVVVELKASFDERANIRWASRLEEAGVHVTYGVVGLKTHCKTILVVRHDFSGLQRYAHIGTGNYHAGTARQYSDMGILTCDEDIGADLTELFNYLTTGYTPKRNYRKILPAPRELKKALISKIRREVEVHSDKTPGLIQFKMNALEDADITRELYLAAQAGVHIDLIIRDTCRLRPGIPGLSENVRVISIVGRFLEHSRVYYFRNSGDEEYYIGSADAMLRNLEHRVEVVAPVEAPALREELRTILDTQLQDTRSAWEMQSDGSYIQSTPATEDAIGSQEALMQLAHLRQKSAKRLRRRKTQGMSRRNIRR